MRLIIGETLPEGSTHPLPNYVVECDDCFAPTACENHELKIPSGFQTGIKLVGTFEIIEGVTTELILDFDVQQSVVKAGSSGQYLLKPTIKVIGENAVVSGTVTDGSVPLIEALVTAQKQGAAANETDIVQSSTMTDEQGEYTMYLVPGTYNIVAYAVGFDPECAVVEALSNTSHGQDFALSAISTGTVTVTIVGTTDPVTLSFRKQGVCDAAEWTVVTFLNVTAGSHVVSLPRGAVSDPESYHVVASTDTETSEDDVDVVEGDDTLLVTDFGS
jgi:hypothetical protein